MFKIFKKSQKSEIGVIGDADVTPKKTTHVDILHRALQKTEEKSEPVIKTGPLRADKETKEELPKGFNLGQYLTDIEKDAITTIDLSDQKQLHYTKVAQDFPQDSLGALAVLSDGHLAIGLKQKIEIWAIQFDATGSFTKMLVKTLQKPAGKKEAKKYSIKKLVILNEDQLASIDYNSTYVDIWSLKSGKWITELKQGELAKGEDEKTLLGILPLPNDELLGVTEGRTTIWNVKKNKIILSFQQRIQSADLVGLALLPDGKIICSDCSLLFLDKRDKEAKSKGPAEKIWRRVADKTISFERAVHPQNNNTLAVLPDGRVALPYLEDNKNSIILINDLSVITEERNFNVDKGIVEISYVTKKSVKPTKMLKSEYKISDVTGILSLLVLPDGTLVSGGTSGSQPTRFWDLKQGCCIDATEELAITRDKQATSIIRSLAILPNGCLISAGYNFVTFSKPVFGPLQLVCIEQLLNALKKNHSVTDLNLSNVPTITDSLVPAFTELLKVNNKITKLNLNKTGISITGMREIYNSTQNRTPNITLLHESISSIETEKSEAAAAERLRKEQELKTKQEAEEKRRQEEKQSMDLAKSPIAVSTPAPTTTSTGVSESKEAKAPDASIPLISVSFEIPYGELSMGKKLGQGGYGAVYQATFKYEQVAVKQLLLSHLSVDSVEEFKAEASIMAKLRSRFTVQFYGYCIKPEYCLVMEYMPKGSLYNLLHSKETLDWSMSYKIVTDIACGLAFLHSSNVFHRDLKSLNVLLDENYRAKLCDFGLSKVKSETRSSTSKGGAVGTLAWMAPELLDPDTHFAASADIYSMAITFWEVATRKVPFGSAPNPQLIPIWASQGKREKIPDDCPPKLATIIIACWEQDPKKRPTAARVADYLRSDQTVFKSEVEPLSTLTSSDIQANLASRIGSDLGNSTIRPNLMSDAMG